MKVNCYICIKQLKKRMSKPFIFGVATAGDNFTYREQEVKRLLVFRLWFKREIIA